MIAATDGRSCLALLTSGSGCISILSHGVKTKALAHAPRFSYVAVRSKHLNRSPLPWVEPPFVAQVGLLSPAVVRNYGSILSALVLFLLRSAGRLGHLFSRVPRRAAGAAPPAPRDISRRRVLQAGVAGVAAAPFVFVGYGTAYATRAYRVTELSLPFGGPLRVAHLSEIHAGLP
jgi:hypothetical protein